MSVNALRLIMVFLLMGLPTYLFAVDPTQQADNMDAQGRAEEAAENQRLIDYYKAQGMTGAIDAGTAYKTNMAITRTNLKDTPAYNTDYIRRANQEAAVGTNSINQGVGLCYKSVAGQPLQAVPCNDSENRGGASVGPSDYVASGYNDSALAVAPNRASPPPNTNILPGQKDNPQNRPTLSNHP